MQQVREQEQGMSEINLTAQATSQLCNVPRTWAANCTFLGSLAHSMSAYVPRGAVAGPGPGVGNGVVGTGALVTGMVGTGVGVVSAGTEVVGTGTGTGVVGTGTGVVGTGPDVVGTIPGAVVIVPGIAGVGNGVADVGNGTTTVKEPGTGDGIGPVPTSVRSIVNEELSYW